MRINGNGSSKILISFFQKFRLRLSFTFQIRCKMSPAWKIFFLFFISLLAVAISHPLMTNMIDEQQQSDMIDLSSLGVMLFSEPDEAVGRAVQDWSPDDSQNPEELGTYLEGDMLIPGVEGRNGLVSASSRWPEGKVPFVISSSIG